MKRVLFSLALMLCGSYVCFSQTIAETDSVKARVESEQPAVVTPQPSTANVPVGQNTLATERLRVGALAGMETQEGSMVNGQSSMVNGQCSMFNGQWIGYLSYDSALVRMRGYADVMLQMEQERKAYDEEMQRVENEFNAKYEEFLENRKDFPRTILLKRQTELQDLLQKNIAFKNQSRRELRQREKDLLQPLRDRLNKAVAALAKEKGLVLVVNTDSDACPFIDPSMSIDLNIDILLLLSK